VDVVVHEDPRVDRTVAFTDVATEAIKEVNPVLVIFKDGRSIDPPHDDMVHGTRDV
jgi:hypothetical protein